MAKKKGILRPDATGTVHDEPGGGELHPHAVPLWLLAAVFGSLLVLTFLTVMATHLDLGSWNIWIALLIAGAKAVLVAEIFMHLYWDRPFHRVLLWSSVLFVVLFIGIAMMDSKSYQPEVIQGYAPGIQQ